MHLTFLGRKTPNHQAQVRGLRRRMIREATEFAWGVMGVGQCQTLKAIVIQLLLSFYLKEVEKGNSKEYKLTMYKKLFFDTRKELVGDRS